MVIKGKISPEWKGEKVFVFFKTESSNKKIDIISIDNDELEFEIDTNEDHGWGEYIDIFIYCKNDANNITYIGNYVFNGVGELVDDLKIQFPNFLINGEMIMFPAYNDDSPIYKKLLIEKTLDYVSKVDKKYGIKKRG